MILKSFKGKSNRKFVEELLKARTAAVSPKKIKSVGVIVHMAEYSDFEVFRSFMKTLNIRENRVKIVGYSQHETDNENLWDTYFNAKDFGWKGRLNSIDLKEFVNRDYDLLISYYKQNLLELNLITAQSRANFKVGLVNVDQRLNDLIIDVEPKNYKLFFSELKKYLNVLNKI